MQGGWCHICGSSQRQEVAGSKTGPTGPRTRFVLCLHCGHAYQDPMPGEAELCHADIRDRSLPRMVGPETGHWLADLVEPVVQHRTLLAIRYGLDGLDRHHGLLGPFRERGWSIYEVASTSALQGRPSESALDSRRPWPRRPSRTFSLILGGPVERLPDPVPAICMFRRHLDDDGLLFLAMPNLLDPCPTERMAQELFRGSHARLYSPGMAQTLLARSGFRTEALRMHQGDGMLGLLGKPAEAPEDQPFDDPTAVEELFHVLQWPGSADRLGWNLASLAETQAWVLPALCRQHDQSAFVVRRSGRCVVALEGRTADGDAVPIVKWGELDGYQQAATALPRQGEQEETIIQLGLGSGELAAYLAERLSSRGHLFIWEADTALARRTLELVDLSSLWLSPRVTLLLGEDPVLPPAQRQRLFGPAILHSSNSARCWNVAAYRQILGRLDLSGVRSQVATAATGGTGS